MKKSTTHYVLVLILVFTLSSMMRSQSSMTSQDNWRPFNVQIDNTNTLNGVAFFKKPLTCTTKEAIVFKVVNLNAFAVNVKWHLKNHKTVIVSIPAKGNLGGSCETLSISENNDFEKTLALLKDSGVSEVELLSSVKVEVTQVGN